MFDLDQFVGAFVATWNETDADARLRQIRALWAPHGKHVSKGRDATGYDALFERISGSNERSVVERGYRFEASHNAERLGSVLKFNWRMTDRAGTVAAVGLEVIELDTEGRIETEYQFIEPDLVR